MKAKHERREVMLKAEAIRLVQEAYAQSLRILSEANPSEQVLAIKRLEAFQKAADGKATKIIIPSDLSKLAGLSTTVKELFGTDTSAE